MIKLTFLVSLMLPLCSLTASALGDQDLVLKYSEDGDNATVGGIWLSSITLHSVLVGGEEHQVEIVPVTKDAAAKLKALSKDQSHNCSVQGQMVVSSAPTYAQAFRFFALDLDCR